MDDINLEQLLLECLSLDDITLEKLICMIFARRDLDIDKLLEHYEESRPIGRFICGTWYKDYVRDPDID
jgi:hypothetical protein